MRRSAALLLALGIVVVLTALNAGFFFHQPYYEFWDSAANSLSILRAKHFAQLYGPYSRYGFYHPGAGYFYVEALGEWLFYDVLHVAPAPFNGQLLMHLVLAAGLFAAGIRAFTDWLPPGRRWGFACAALVLAILHFDAAGGLPSFVNFLGGPTAFLSNWSAHFLVLPFFCLLTAGASVAAGRGRDLPLLVLAGGLLVHAHVAQPLFVVPTAGLAYAGLAVAAVRPQRARGSAVRWWTAAYRESPRAHLLAAALLAVFLLPLALDACRGRESNLAAILRHLHTQSDLPKPLARSAAYFLQFAAYAPYQAGDIRFGHYTLPGFLAYLRSHAVPCILWLGAGVLVLQAPVRHLRARTLPGDPPDTRRFLACAAGLAALALALTLFWGTRQEGVMYYYNSWYNFGLLYFVALVAAAIVCTEYLPRPSPPSARSTWAWRAAGAVAVGLAGGWCAPGLRVHDRYVGDGNRAMHEGILRALAASRAAHPGACNLLTIPVPLWSHAVAVGLELARAGEPFIVPPGWEINFGREHGWNVQGEAARREGISPWYFVLAGMPRLGVGPDAPAFPLHPGVSLMFTPPVMALRAAGDVAALGFAPGGNAEGFLVGGWSAPEPAGRWSDQPWAALSFRPLAVAGSRVELRLHVLPFARPFFAAGTDRQRLAASFNGEPLGPEQAITAQTMAVFSVPVASWNAAAAGADPVATLRFAFPDAVSPASLDPAGRNQDQRRLGLHFYDLQLRVIP